MFDSTIWTLAQADAPPPPPPDETAPQDGATTTEPGTPQNGATDGEGPPPPGGDWTFLFLMLLLVVFFVIFAVLPQRRERKRKEQMIDAMKKGDRVQTIGGIVGTVAEIREHEVVVKVDESNNTRLHFAKAAIAAVLDKENAKSGS